QISARHRKGDAAKMASLCKRQQCTIERRGFRQELDSWRHKLIHCVGFESILEGLFGWRNKPFGSISKISLQLRTQL
uniref:Uncharacterized protein n=1 Tax=Echeneis naucrates TaxID=173247 RepID=A0A665UHF5_ECHNA